MQTSYGRYDEENSVRHTRNKSGRRRQVRGKILNHREKQRFIQLVICSVLFAVVLAGKGAFPQKMETFKASALTLLQRDTNFKAAFVGLGRAISEGEPILETLGELWVETVGRITAPVNHASPPIQAPIYEKERSLLENASCGCWQELLARRFGWELQTGQITEEEDEAANTTAGWAEREDATQSLLLEGQPQAAYNGPPLPENCTMEKKSLELIETMTPVLGVISSGYGYRVHPIDKENKFHYGADVVAAVGTPVYAFADGVVDYIGESKAYGQYIQLRHNGGVTTFYAHCSKLCAKKGQKVSIGDTIAKVGESGNTTGAHLHFEIRLNGTFLNPTYYIDTM